MSEDGKAPPRFCGTRPREKLVPLDYPVEYDGKVYDGIRVRRMTVAEVGAFIEAAGGEDAKTARLPMFDAPPEVLDALDADDAERVNEVVRDFLPRALRPEGASRPPNGETSPQS